MGLGRPRCGGPNTPDAYPLRYWPVSRNPLASDSVAFSHLQCTVGDDKRRGDGPRAVDEYPVARCPDNPERLDVDLGLRENQIADPESASDDRRGSRAHGERPT